MIKTILESYSYGELANYVGENYIAEYKRLRAREVLKSELIVAAETIIGYEILTNELHRRTLIERMDSETAQAILNGCLERIGYIVPIPKINIFDFLIQVANAYPEIFFIAMGFDELIDELKNTDKSIQGISSISAQYPLYPYQQSIVSKVNKAFLTGGKHKCLIHLPTGAGKTRTAINIACEHLRSNSNGLVLWLADTSELCTQASNEFRKAWSILGNREAKLYEYFSDADISLGGIESGFLVAGLQKLNSTRGSSYTNILYQQLKNHVTLIIFDEAHKAIAPTYALTVNDMFSNKENSLLIGLSATPGRKLQAGDDEDFRLANFFDNNKITMKVTGYESPIKYLVEEGYLAKAEFKKIEYTGNKIVNADLFTVGVNNHEILEALSEDDNRNRKLLEVIKNECAHDKSIIVFACSVEHSRLLSVLLAFDGIKAYSLDSKFDNTESRRLKISDYSRGKVKVLINYSILTAGFDAPITSVAIIARPTDSLVQFSQMAGRAMRGKKSNGNSECTIYTVQDDIPAFKSVIHAFEHWDELWNEV